MASQFLSLQNMSSYIDPTRRYANLLLGTSWVEAGLGIVMFVCQTVTSWRYTQRFRADYWTSVATLIISLAAQAFLTYSVEWSSNFGNYNSFKTMKPLAFLVNFEQGLKWGWLAMITAIVAISIGKLSIIAFLIQVRHQAKATRPWFLWFIGFSNILIGVVTVVLLLSECKPISKLWKIFGPGVCNTKSVTRDVAYLQGAWSAFSDFALAFYPITIVWNLQMRLRNKIGLCVLMGFGVLAGVCAIIKTTQLNVLDNTSNIGYGVAPLIVATMTEQWITFIVACVPPARPFVKSLFRKVSHGVATVAPTNTPFPPHARPNRFPNETPLEKAQRLTIQTPKSHMFGRLGPGQTFHSLAYADDVATTHHDDIYEMMAELTGSKENIIVRDSEGDRSGALSATTTPTTTRRKGGIVLTKTTDVTVERYSIHGTHILKDDIDPNLTSRHAVSDDGREDELAVASDRV